MHLRIVLVTGILASLAGVSAVAAPAASSGAGCQQWTANVDSSGARGILDYDFSHAVVAPTGKALQQTTLSWNHAYKVTQSGVVVRFGEVGFTIAQGSVFRLWCSAQSRGGPTFPTLLLGAGQIEVADPERVAGAVITWEGLYGPVPGLNGAITFTIKRTTLQPLADTLSIFRAVNGRDIKAVRGTTSSTVNGPSPLNVTPYVGPSPGTCRHSHDAQLSSAGAGTARYSGLR